MKVQELMSKTVATVAAGSSVKDAATMMSDRGIGSIIVTNQEFPLGILTERDIIKDTVSRDLDPAGVTVDTIMRSPLIYVTLDSTVRGALKRMIRKGIRRLAVFDGMKLVGVITETDILRAFPYLVDTGARSEEEDVEEDGDRECFSGYCSVCGSFNHLLCMTDGRAICDFCLEDN